jgi:N-acetylneuraminic acid mutarotase
MDCTPFSFSAREPRTVSLASFILEKLPARRLSAFFLCLVVLGLLPAAAFAQTGEWTWMDGPSTLDCPTPLQVESCYGPALFGKLGASSTSNIPGGRSSANSWTDASGNFWLFGGLGVDSAGNTGYLNDLWKFSPSSGQWTWVGGSSSVVCLQKDQSGNCITNGQPGVSASPGVGSTTNIPGGRASQISWTDANGNFWLFGGTGFDTAGNLWQYLNDLWEFSPSSGEWTLVNGSSVPASNPGSGGVYGTLGTAAAGNVPGGRFGSSAWTDSAGNLWLFGGYGLDSGANKGELDDLWEFNTTNKQWTWMSGSSTFTCWAKNASGCSFWAVTPPVSTPEGRDGAVAWTDSGGNLWLFGGETAAADVSNLTGGLLSDLWEFSPSTASWTVRGYCPSPQYAACTDIDLNGVYGTLGVLALGNYPGGREYGEGWSNGSGTGWVLGGDGPSFTGTPNGLNDLWEFDSFSGNWIWQGGSKSPYAGIGNGPSSVYGTLDSASINNLPGFRSGASTWTDGNGNLWLFGGDGMDSAANYGRLNDLWQFIPHTNGLPAAATPTFSVPSGTYTSAQSVTLNDATAGASLYYTLDGTSPNINSSVYTQPIAVSATSTLKVVAVGANHANSAIATANYLLPVTFSLSAAPGTLTVNSGSNGPVTITVAPQNGFDSAVAFSCSGLPAGATCGFLPATVTPPGTTSTVLTVTVASTTATLHRSPGTLFPGTALAAALCCFGFKKRRRWQLLLLLAVSLTGLSLLNGCGNGGSSGGNGNSNPQPVSSTITVSGTSDSMQQTTTFTLTVN